MTHTSQPAPVSLDWKTSTVTIVPVALLIAFWLSIGLQSLGVSIPFVQSALGLVLLTFVPGALLTHLLGVQPRSIGEFSIFALGLSLVTLSITAVVSSVVLPPVGIPRPLSFFPQAVVHSAIVFALTVLMWFTNPDLKFAQALFTGSWPMYAALASLPVFSIFGAVGMNQYGTSLGMFPVIATMAAIVVVTSTKYIRPRQYPAVIFSLALSLLLQRNLTSDHVVGADIQYTYFLSELLANTQLWSPNLSGATSSLPIVTTVPVTYGVVTGLELATIFTLVYPIVFSFTPLGIYYLASDVFDEDVALYGSLFFLFYHGTFYMTPGKQRLSELFIVLLLLLYFRHGTTGTPKKIASALLAVGLVHSHYGTTYIFGFSILATAIGLTVVRGFERKGRFRYDLSLTYPIALLVGATAWYAYASNELVSVLLGLPASIVRQAATLSEGGVVGSGSDFVATQTTLFDQTTLYLYIVLSVLLCLGLAWRTITNLDAIRRGETPDFVEFTVLAIPLFVFLGSSYFVILDLTADRMYQITLPVLGHFAAFGFLLLSLTLTSLRDRATVHWSPLAALLAALLLVNSGFAAAAVGAPADYTFDDDAHDYAFSDEELEAAHWLAQDADVEPIDGTADENGEVTIYTDQITHQLFRSVIPASHYNVEVIMVKSGWNPTFDPEETTDGYVFIRHNAIADDDQEDVRLTQLGTEDVETILEDRTVVFENEDVTIVEPTDETTS